MTLYTAKFSTGTKTRNSDRIYTHAAAYVNQETGEIREVTFSAKPNPRPQRGGIFALDTRCGYGSYKQYKRAMKKNEALEKIWKVETVEL